MTVQSINKNVIDLGNENYTRHVNSKVNKNTNNHNEYDRNFLSKRKMNTSLTSTYFSASKMTLNYSNSDGDTISLQVEHVEYQKSMLSLGLPSTSEKWHEIVENIKDEFKQPYGIDGIPEYWNAENTSQRIVDFATSFYGLTESNGKEYYDIIRSAIEEGFRQAREILGELPNELTELTNRTYNLVMEKLDDWAGHKGIEIQTN